jgi:hypothetical protein
MCPAYGAGEQDAFPWETDEARGVPRQGAPGGVVEWLMAPVLKTGEPKGSVGSNPTPSVAISLPPQAFPAIRASGGSGLQQAISRGLG